MKINKKSYLLLSTFYIFQINAHGFAPHTLVKNSSTGWWAIEQAVHLSHKKKQQVKSYDFAVKNWTTQPIISGALSKTNCFVVIKIDQGSKKGIICTPTQEFYLVQQKKWVPAYELKVNDVLLADKNKHAKIKSIELVKKTLDVCSIEVQNTHTFLVSPDLVLTHNMVIPAVAAGLSIPFGTGCSGGFAGIAFGPVGVIGGLAVGGIIGCAIKFGMHNKVAEYKLHYDVEKIGRCFEAQNKQEITKRKNYKKQRKKDGFNKNHDNDNKNKPTKEIKISEDDIPHMFKSRDGHLPDTPANRNLLIDLASDMKNFLGPDKHGTEWYGKITSEGKQLWATVRNGIIRNGGLNNTPKTFNSETGLSRIFKPKGKL